MANGEGSDGKWRSATAVLTVKLAATLMNLPGDIARRLVLGAQWQLDLASQLRGRHGKNMALALRLYRLFYVHVLIMKSLPAADLGWELKENLRTYYAPSEPSRDIRQSSEHYSLTSRNLLGISFYTP